MSYKKKSSVYHRGRDQSEKIILEKYDEYREIKYCFL